MATIRRYYPAFVDTDDPRIPFEFTNIADLLSIPWVAHWTEAPGFEGFVKARDEERTHLMAVLDDGFSWWVIGYLTNAQSVPLPIWKGWKHLVRMPDGTEQVLGNEVVSSCGGELTLRDGTIGFDVLYERRMKQQAVDSAKRTAGICPTCDTPYRTIETFDKDRIRVESHCDTCVGWKMTHWRPL